MTSKRSSAAVAVREVGWEAEQVVLARIRRRVFIEEQQVPEALEWDGLDATASHLLACVDDQAAGCARLLPDGQLGRMAVLPQWRGQGIGWALLQAALALACRRGLPEVRLAAQVAAIGFYQRAGFTLCSATYLDAGIPHRDMVLPLTA